MLAINQRRGIVEIMKDELTWNAGKISSGKKVWLLANCEMRKGEMSDNVADNRVVAVAVPFGTTGYKAYDENGDMVRFEGSKIWPSLSAIKSHFE